MFVQIAKLFPGQMVKLLLKAAKNPQVTFETNNMIVQATGTLTAYAIQPNTTLTPLFVLNLVGDTASITIRIRIIKEDVFGLEKHARFLAFAGDQCQRPCVRQRNAAGWSRHPEQVSDATMLSEWGKWGQKVFVKMNGSLILPHLHRMDLTLETSYVGEFQVRADTLTRVR